jgi:hypothetical protein
VIRTLDAGADKMLAEQGELRGAESPARAGAPSGTASTAGTCSRRSSEPSRARAPTATFA